MGQPERDPTQLARRHLRTSTAWQHTSAGDGQERGNVQAARGFRMQLVWRMGAALRLLLLC